MKKTIAILAAIALALAALCYWLYWLAQMPPTFPAGVKVGRYQ